MKFSIAITCYNYAEYLGSCIESCLGQKTKDSFEVIVVDDGSTDESVHIAKSFAPFIKILNIPNLGVEGASNLGISNSTGEFVVRVDADDLLDSRYLMVMGEAIVQKKADFYYSEYEVIDANGIKLFEKALPDFDANEIQERGDFLATGTLHRRAGLVAGGMYNEKHKNSGLENFELILKLIGSGYKGCCVHQNLFSYRHHRQSLSQAKREKIVENGRQLLMEMGLGTYKTNNNHPYGLVLS